MPNFLMMSELNTLPDNKRYKGGGGPKIDEEAQMRRQEELMDRQMARQREFQIEAEGRMRAERERERIHETLRRQEAAAAKSEAYQKQQQQETALVGEMTGQAKEDVNDFGGGFNLAMPTIERPGYESEIRPV